MAGSLHWQSWAFYSYYSQLCHVFRPCIVQISPSALSPSTAMAVPHGQPPAIQIPPALFPPQFLLVVNKLVQSKKDLVIFLWYQQGSPEITTIIILLMINDTINTE